MKLAVRLYCSLPGCLLSPVFRLCTVSLCCQHLQNAVWLKDPFSHGDIFSIFNFLCSITGPVVAGNMKNNFVENPRLTRKDIIIDRDAESCYYWVFAGYTGRHPHPESRMRLFIHAEGRNSGMNGRPGLLNRGFPKTTTARSRRPYTPRSLSQYTTTAPFLCHSCFVTMVKHSRWILRSFPGRL